MTLMCLSRTTRGIRFKCLPISSLAFHPTNLIHRSCWTLWQPEAFRQYWAGLRATMGEESSVRAPVTVTLSVAAERV
jgi:hypothetical protein